MQRLLKRRASELMLDLLFVTWVTYILVSGQVLPNQLVALFYDPAPITVVHEPQPLEAPADADPASPEAQTVGGASFA